MKIYINGTGVRVTAQQAIAKGGEADIFDLGNGQVLKLFKSPDHADYQAFPQEQQAASLRIAEHQEKLRQFPQNLPSRVVTPLDLATDQKGGKIVGYTMPFLQSTEPLMKYSDRTFRQQGVATQAIGELFLDLHDTLSKLHFAGVVIGDFNDLNVLVRGTEAFLIDADSFQFDNFLCRVFTARFVDPLRCDPQATQPMLNRPFNQDSDWYAFSVLLMQSLLLVDPYGGVFKPADPARKVLQGARSLHRITVFHPEVKYPKPAISYKVLPDELLHHFHQVFERDLRGEFPRSLLETLHWQTCAHCGLEHARYHCPTCAHPAPGAVKSVTVVRGRVVATRLLDTEGVILCASSEQGEVRWLLHHHGQFLREDGTVVLNGNLSPQMRWRIHRKTTWLGYQNQVVKFHPGQEPQRLAVDRRGAIAQFEVRGDRLYWSHQGQLQQQEISQLNNKLVSRSPIPIGTILPAQTYFWVGDRFGFGFYQAGQMRVAFVFDSLRSGLNDRVVLPPWQGTLLDATCALSPDYAWLFLTTQEQGQQCDRCLVIRSDGSLVATVQSTNDDHWLAVLGRGRSRADPCPYLAIGNFLLAPTDEGIIRVEIQQNQLVQTNTFPDTEPFVNSHSQLRLAKDGIYCVGDRAIVLLKIQ